MVEVPVSNDFHPGKLYYHYTTKGSFKYKCGYKNGPAPCGADPFCSNCGQANSCLNRDILKYTFFEKLVQRPCFRCHLKYFGGWIWINYRALFPGRENYRIHMRRYRYLISLILCRGFDIYAITISLDVFIGDLSFKESYITYQIEGPQISAEFI
jgi:hypothetical protein